MTVGIKQDVWNVGEGRYLGHVESVEWIRIGNVLYMGPKSRNHKEYKTGSTREDWGKGNMDSVF